MIGPLAFTRPRSFGAGAGYGARQTRAKRLNSLTTRS